MKKLLLLITAIMCLSAGVNAQWVFMSNDTTNSNSHWSGYFASGTDNYTNISSNTTDKVEGTASMQVDYKIHASEGWGGYTVRVFANDPSLPNSRYDLSSGKYLSYWYKVTQAATKTNAGDVNFEFKIKEKTGDGGEDRWLKSAGTILETAGGWTQVIISLNQDSLSMQAGDDNKKFEPWAIYGFELAFVYITGDNIHTASGQVLLDKFQILGERYQPIMNLDDAADTTSDRKRKDAFWALNDMSWDGDAGARHMILSNETSDKVQGAGALKVDYAVVGSQDWGGYAELEHEFATPPADMFERSGMAFYFKNLVANQLAGRFMLRFDVTDIDPGTQATEMWTAVAPINMDVTSEWQLVHLPFKQAVNAENANIPWYELKVGDIGFTHREGDNGKVFDPTNIKKIRVGLIILGGAKGPDKVASGQFLLDFFTPTGYKNADKTPPAAPEDIIAFYNANTNIVSWTDTPDESKETYSIFYDSKPVTDLSASSVLTLGSAIPEGSGSYTHYLFAPYTDKQVSYYYNMSAKDEAGNEGTIGTSSPVTTGTAKGIPVVSNIKPAGFVADGNLKEWTSSPIVPFILDGNDGVSHTKGAVDGKSDIWMKAWVAVSNDSLFVAYEVHDDIIITDTTKNTYEVDSPDLFISTYKYKGKDHASYRRGLTPDYHFRFNYNKATNDQGGGTISRMESPNYEWKIVNDTTYVVEWGISLAEIAALNAGDALFSVKEGEMMALDFVVNDADATGTREGYRIWSPLNDDNSWSTHSNWNYTWYGNPASNFAYVGVEEVGGIPQAFTLEQNYPNPFNPTTAINFTMPQSGNVTLKVYNILGSEIATLVNGFQTAGKHTVNFNAGNLSSGIYFVKMNANGFTSSKKMMLVK